MTLLFACEPAVTTAEVERSGCSCQLDNVIWDLADLIDSASDTLTILSGGLVTGRCTKKVRPCADYAQQRARVVSQVAHQGRA